MKKIIIPLAIGCALALGASITPYMSAHGLRQAILDRDEAAFSEHVDLPALKDNLTRKLAMGKEPMALDSLMSQAQVLSKMPGHGAQDAKAAMAQAQALFSAMAKSSIERATTAQALMYAMGEGRGLPKDESSLSGMDSLWRVRWASPERFAISVTSPLSAGAPDTASADQAPELNFVFAREGIRWKLVDIESGADKALATP